MPIYIVKPYEVKEEEFEAIAERTYSLRMKKRMIRIGTLQ